MKDWTAHAFVLRLGHFREIDLWLKLLLPKVGVLTAFAFGGVKSRHRFCGCLDFCNTLICRLRESKRPNLYTLEEATLLDGPILLKKDVTRMGMAANCVRFLEMVGTVEESAEAVYALMENVRYCLEAEEHVSHFFPVYFRLHLAALLGFAPQFHLCGSCGEDLKEEGAYMQVDEGLVLCPRCQGGYNHKYQLSLGGRERLLLQDVAEELPTAWDDTALSLKSRQNCLRAIDSFVEFHLGIVSSAHGFRRI